MNEEVQAYLECLKYFKEVKKPPMPKFDLLAYNDNEYKFAIEQIGVEFDNCDDMYLTLRHLQGE